MQNLRPLWQTHGHMSLAVSSAHVWPHRSGHCAQNFHPDTHCNIQIHLLFTLPAPSILTLLRIPWAEPPIILGYSPLPLLLGTNSTDFTSLISCILLEKEWQKQTRGEKSNPFLFKTVFNSSPPCSAAQDDQDAWTSLPHLSCKSNLHLGTSNFSVFSLTFFQWITESFFFFNGTKVNVSEYTRKLVHSQGHQPASTYSC